MNFNRKKLRSFFYSSMACSPKK
uniref:Uncharacterized protein n=1 Tax=Lepeophtheirus salmonis TaxID=72036 RepID=A0A0K2T4Y3_LEPSM